MCLKTGTTFETFNAEGNIPVANDLLIKNEIGLEISSCSSFKILAEILLGPVDFDVENEAIISVISSDVVGERKNEFGLRFLRKLEK